MKKFNWLIASAVVATAGFTACVSAQTSDAQTEVAQAEVAAPAEDSGMIDLAALTCRSYLQTPGDEQSNLMIFMHGYMSGVAGTTTLDGPALATASDAIVDGCIDSPDSTLLSQFEANR